jgi:hypothetical protein
MGYRSDVHMVVQGVEEEVLTAWGAFRLTNPWTGIGKDPCEEHMSITRSKVYVTICFTAEDWKWYGGYEDVDRINKLWSHFSDWPSDNEVSGMRMSGAFIRIGEDDTDIDTKYFGDGPYDLARVTRSIDSQYSVDLANDIRSKL